MYTSLAYDHSAPQRVHEAIKLELGEDDLDTHMSCMLEDTGGKACDGRRCAYGGPNGTKVYVEGYKDRKHNPKPHVDPPPLTPLALGAKRQAPKKRKAAPKRQPAPKRKAKRGRRK